MTTKDKILKSALKLFARQGIDKTSTREITKDVGIAEGTLFVHFKTKQELIDSLYLDIKKGLVGNLSDLVDTKVSTEKNIKSMSEYMIKYLIKNYNELIFMEIMEKDPKISQRAKNEGRKMYLVVLKQIGEWIKKGELKKLDREFIGGIVWGNVVSIAKYCKESRKKVSKSMLDIIWDSVKG